MPGCVSNTTLLLQFKTSHTLLHSMTVALPKTRSTCLQCRSRILQGSNQALTKKVQRLTLYLNQAWSSFWRIKHRLHICLFRQISPTNTTSHLWSGASRIMHLISQLHLDLWYPSWSCCLWHWESNVNCVLHDLSHASVPCHSLADI